MKALFSKKAVTKVVSILLLVGMSTLFIVGLKIWFIQYSSDQKNNFNSVEILEIQDLIKNSSTSYNLTLENLGVNEITLFTIILNQTSCNVTPLTIPAETTQMVYLSSCETLTVGDPVLISIVTERSSLKEFRLLE